MGATLEQFDLSLEHDYRLPGRCHEALVLNRPDVIEGVHASMLDAGADVLETDTFQASRLKLAEWGLEDHTHEINLKAAQIARKAAGEHRFVAGAIGPTGFLPASDDPTLGQITFAELVDVFTEQATGLLEGGVDLIIIETAQDILELKAAIFGAREAGAELSRAVPIQCSVSLLPQGGKMLLGTDISAVLATLEALERRRDRAQLLHRPRGHARRDPLPGRVLLGPRALHPQRRPAAPGPERRDDLPGAARAAGRRARRVRRPLRRLHRRRLLRHHARTTSRRSPSASRATCPNRGRRRRPPHVSSMIAATPLVQDPRPTLVGERVNSQGSRKAKEMLLADDYDGLLVVAEDQVAGGAHVLDVCVALTERQDEAEQMREVVKRISLTQPAPIQIDSTEPDVIDAALQQIPGRAIVNSVNLEAGRDKLDRVVPLAKAHGAALIALTIDEVGMAKTAERKLEVAQRITESVLRRARARPRGADLRLPDVHAHDRRPGVAAERGRDDRGDPAVKAELPGVKTSLGVSQRQLRRRPPRALGAQQRVPAPLRRGRARPGDGQPEPHHPVRRDPRGRARAGRRPGVQPARGRARAVHRPLRGQGPRRRRRRQRQG